MIKKHFNKNLIISAEEEERFQLSNSCWICDKLHWGCNTNLKLSKKILVIFHNLRGYDSHLIIKEISKFDVKGSVTSNELEKYMAFTIDKNLVFGDSMQFMNSSLD